MGIGSFGGLSPMGMFIDKGAHARMKKTKSFSYAKYGYIFSIPFVVAYLIFSLYPTINTVILGFTDAKGMSGLTNWNFLPANDLWRDQVRQYTSGAKTKDEAIKSWQTNVSTELGLDVG